MVENALNTDSQDDKFPEAQTHTRAVRHEWLSTKVRLNNVAACS